MTNEIDTNILGVNLVASLIKYDTKIFSGNFFCHHNSVTKGCQICHRKIWLDGGVGGPGFHWYIKCTKYLYNFIILFNSHIIIVFLSLNVLHVVWELFINTKNKIQTQSWLLPPLWLLASLILEFKLQNFYLFKSVNCKHLGTIRKFTFFPIKMWPGLCCCFYEVNLLVVKSH